MASSSCDNNYQSIAKQCLDLTKACVSNGQVVKLSLSIGTSFSYNFCSEHNAKPLPAVLTKKNKSPGTRARDLKRRAAFLHKKAADSSSLPVALDSPPPESHEVEPSQTQPNLSSPSFEPGPLETESNDFEDNSDPCIVPLPNNNSTLCVCQSAPCICLPCKPLTPITDQPLVPSLKIKKTQLGWTSTTSLPDPANCDNCDQPFLDWNHICDSGDKDDDDKSSKCESVASPEEDILDLNGCHDVVSSDLFSTQQKIAILQQNCVCLLKAQTINFDLARFCYSHSKYFQLKLKDHTLGIPMQNLVENIFNPEFDKEVKNNYG